MRRAAAAAGGVCLFHVVGRHVLGGPGRTPPSDVVTRAIIGCGERGYYNGFVRPNPEGQTPRILAVCDVDRKHLARALKRVGRACEGCTDFRRVMERKDIDTVYIMTPPHWHALISIAAAQAGKDIYCEKPMTKFIAEGRAVVNAVKRYGAVFQIGTFGRFGASRSAGNIETHKIMSSGLLQPCRAVIRKRGGFKVRAWCGMTNLAPQPVPEHLDYNMWLGPAPVKPYHPQRVHWVLRGPAKSKGFRGYWDYDGGGLTDMGQHHLDGSHWTYARDDTSPVEVEAYAPWPPHPDAVGMWGWAELKYADGLKLVLESGEWGDPYEGEAARGVSMDDLSEADRRKVRAMPDPAPLVSFDEAVKTRKQAGGHAEASHRCATILHLANIAIRIGRKLHYDPVAERIVGDEQANRLVDIPMRAPWHL